MEKKINWIQRDPTWYNVSANEHWTYMSKFT